MMSAIRLDEKYEFWKHQLLDLGKRNRMINYRETRRSTMKLIEPSFDELFHRIAIKEDKLTFKRPVGREMDIRVFSLLSLLENLSAALPVTVGDIMAEGTIAEQRLTLNNLRSKARLSLEEQGTNILYLSFGFIEWCDGKGSAAQRIKSPLILVPVVLTQKSILEPYTLSKHEDDIVVNPTLEYYLKTEYGIELPHFDADKDSINDYLKGLENIADQRGWRILKEASLGLLSFLKISMYNDLLRNEERIKANPVIRAMAGDKDEVNNIPEGLSTFDLDSISTHDCYQVLRADSSQQDAILYSKNNVSFVMQGPPGTGKSQTITNIIAEALADGKKVLFVSEKMAALQVVYRRLQEVHLGDFCLPLHSYKANKREILEQIGNNLRLKQVRVKDTAITSLEELLSIRQELNKYADELHRINPKLNISCYEVYSRLVDVRDAPSVSFSIGGDPLGVSQSQLQAFLFKIKAYSLALQRIGYNVHDNPWEGLISRSTSYEYVERMKAELSTLAEKLRFITDSLAEITELPELGSCINFTALPALADTVAAICELPSVPENWVKKQDTGLLINEAMAARATYEKLRSAEENVFAVFNDSILGFNYNGWKTDMSALTVELNKQPLVKGETADCYIRNASSLRSSFMQLKELIPQTNTAFASINEMLGTELAANEANLSYISQIASLLKTNKLIPSVWFAVDIDNLAEKFVKAQEVIEATKSIKRLILGKWKPEALSLDYKPILMRYNTEYSGAFKVFNSQYRRDRRQIASLSRDADKSIPDKDAMSLLNALETYHGMQEKYNEHLSEIEYELGSYFKGMDTDFDSVLSAVEVAKKLKRLPAYCITPQMSEIVEREHVKENARLDSLLNSAKSIFARVKAVSASNSICMDTAASDFDGAAVLPVIETYISKLESIQEQYNLIIPHLKNEAASIDTIFEAIDALNARNRVTAELTSKQAGFVSLFASHFQGRDTNWDSVLELLKKTDDVKSKPYFSELTAIVNLLEPRRNQIKCNAESILSAYRAARDSFDWIGVQFDRESVSEAKSIDLLYNKVKRCSESISSLEGWIDYQEAKADCARFNLKDFIDKAESASIFENIDRAFLKGFYLMWLDAVCYKAASVRCFRRNTHDERVKKFVELDDMQLSIAQMRIREKLIEDLPSEHRLIRATDEFAVLNRELNKRRNIMPLRKLFRQIPNLLLRLKPCLMMSPLSVSYFLETEAYQFDLVIFDEASQIFPEDAIGAIFRGAQVIIAGDSKQLPPTDFFAATTNNSEADFDINEDDDEGLGVTVSDSILEETASALPNRTLLWHYRSKHENLIAFSNREIYKNSLITFPNTANEVPDMGVEYVYVEDGCYEGRGRNCNTREAQRCVELVAEHIKKYPDRSLGIIAFSEKQQTAIENAIIAFRERMPEHEWFFDESRDEPFFVKNLENVQGDERDTIIFSICYAKDVNGRMYMRFGPLGHEGGERRLNVAITRAKCNIKLVGSILPTDIDLSRTNSEGVRMLRAYIEFARKGTRALNPIVKEESFASEDEFCNVIASFLESHGYKVEMHVGCSDYKIDIAVLNPDVDGEYIAGIECDGLSYMRARTARDRDHLRAYILGNMGWNLYRVWSTEWIRNPIAEGEALLAFLRSAVEKNKNGVHCNTKCDDKDTQTAIESIASETTKSVSKSASANPYGFEYYREANVYESHYYVEEDNLTKVGESVLYITAIEQPLHIELLYRRMGPIFSAGKATESVKNTIDKAIAEKLKGKVIVDGDNFVRLVPAPPVVVRIPNTYDAPRPIEYIHTEEVAAAMLRIIDNSFGIMSEDLATECARVFGFERKGPRIKQKTDAAIEFLVNTGKIRIIDGKTRLITER